MPWILKVPFLIPTWAAAQTWGPLILWKKEYALSAYQPMLAHELRHYVQSSWFLFIGWPIAYLIAWALAGFNYENNWFEKDARAHQTNPNYLAWASKLALKYK